MFGDPTAVGRIRDGLLLFVSFLVAAVVVVAGTRDTCIISRRNVIVSTVIE